MTPRELRASIPALSDVTFFNTGASGPSPKPVLDAATNALWQHKAEAPAADGMYPAAAERKAENRATIASHLGVSPDELALTESTSDGLSAVAAAVDWQPGDRVVRTDFEHPAGILPWERAKRVHGVSVDVLETDRGVVDLDRFAELVDGARMVCVSSISWNYGTRLPVGTLVDIAHDAGARVVVDAVQSAGQTPTDLADWGADVVVGSGHKWLLGPWGSGYLYVREGAEADLHPAQICYSSVVDPDEPDYTLKPSAHRFERGTVSPGPHAGMAAGISMLEEPGLDSVETRIERLTDRLKRAVPADQLLSPRRFESGLVTITVDQPDRVVDALFERGIRIRSLPEPRAVRASVHAFNTADEIDALVDALTACGAIS